MQTVLSFINIGIFEKVASRKKKRKKIRKEKKGKKGKKKEKLCIHMVSVCFSDRLKGMQPAVHIPLQIVSNDVMAGWADSVLV
jgi:hypothetical protein